MIPTIPLKDRKAHGLSEPKCPECNDLIQQVGTALQCACTVWYWVLRNNDETSMGER